MKSYKKWHPRVFLNICLVGWILGIGLTVIAKMRGDSDLEQLFRYLTLIELIGVIYFWPQRNDSDEDWR